MTVQETVQQLQSAPLSYRIQVIELLIQSLKEELTQSQSFKGSPKPFRIRAFNLGADIQIDREEMYLLFYIQNQHN